MSDNEQSSQKKNILAQVSSEIQQAKLKSAKGKLKDLVTKYNEANDVVDGIVDEIIDELAKTNQNMTKQDILDMLS